MDYLKEYMRYVILSDMKSNREHFLTMKITKVIFNSFLASFEVVMKELKYLPEVVGECLHKLRQNQNLIIEGLLLDELGNAIGLF